MHLGARRNRGQLTLEIDDPERLEVSGTDQDVGLLLVDRVEQVARTAFDGHADLDQARRVPAGPCDVLVDGAVGGARRCRVLGHRLQPVQQGAEVLEMRRVGQRPVRPAGREIGIDCAAPGVDDANLSDGGGVDDAPQPEVDLFGRPLGRLRGGNKVIQNRGLHGHVLAQDTFDHGRDVRSLRGIDIPQELLIAEHQSIPDLHDPRLVDAADADVLENLLVDLPHLRRLRDEVIAVEGRHCRACKLRPVDSAQ